MAGDEERQGNGPRVTRGSVSAADYDRALELWPTRLMAGVRNLSVAAHWIDDDRLWLREELPIGHHFVEVDAASGARRDAFDHVAVGRALQADPTRLPVLAYEHLENGMRVTTPAGSFDIDVASGTALPASATKLKAAMPGPGGRTLLRREHDLWLREADGRERPLTDDGAPFHAWGATIDLDLQAIARSRGAAEPTLCGCLWSPDGGRLLIQRPDEREVASYPYYEVVPAGGSPRPVVHPIRFTLPGEAVRRREWAILDVASGRRVPVILPDESLDLCFADNGGAWWTPDKRYLHALAQTRSSDRVALLRVDAVSGHAHVVHEETAATFFDWNTFEYHAPIARPLPGDREFLWYSQSDGHGHLYVVDLARGGVSRRLTEGPWQVFDVLKVTLSHIFFTGGGREPGVDPYHRRLYRIDTNAQSPNDTLLLLTQEEGDQALPGAFTPPMAAALGAANPPPAFSPSGRYFVAASSTLNTPPVTWLKATDGSVSTKLIAAEVTLTLAQGWRPPEAFTVKARDGVTDLHGTLFLPRDFDPSRAYPVIERVYAGPQFLAHPRNFAEGMNGAFAQGLAALAELGFAIVLLDGPGTPYRSKSFHDTGWGTRDRLNMTEHRVAIERLSTSRPWLDVSRVGIAGHSYGGYAAVMAMLLEPDFYRVGVSSAGIYDLAWAQTRTPERHFGRPDYGDGRFLKTRVDEVAANYALVSPSSLADRLQGRLLLAYGDLDENIQPAGLMKFADALIKAGKSFDLLCLPGRGHGFGSEPYFQKRLWDYFLTHLQDREPLPHHKLDVAAPVRLFV